MILSLLLRGSCKRFWINPDRPFQPAFFQTLYPDEAGSIFHSHMSPAPNPKTPSMRLLAARELDAMAEQDAFIGLQRATRSGNADMDRSIRDTVAGVIRWQRYLDFLIAHFYKGDAAKMEQGMRTMLRIGLHGLLFTRQPDHAVINETVEAAKHHVRKGAAGLTNGILRAVTRKRSALPVPEGTPEHILGTLHSHPDWMAKRWIELFGQEGAEKLMVYNNQRPMYGLHLADNPAALKMALRASEVDFEESPWSSSMIRMRSLQPIIKAGWLASGKAWVQDEAAALVVTFADAKPGNSALDLCAAPGGKTVQMAQAVGGDGRVVACDIQENRLKLVQENADRLGHGHVQTVARDARDVPQEWLQSFDLVLLDAPCSGFGVLAKRADMRWRRELANLNELVSLQKEMLDAAALCVRPGGILVYSTCTIEPTENSEQVAAFLKSHPEFEREKPPEGFPGEWITEEGDYLSQPFESGMDGAYAARLRRLS